MARSHGIGAAVHGLALLLTGNHGQISYGSQHNTRALYAVFQGHIGLQGHTLLIKATLPLVSTVTVTGIDRGLAAWSCLYAAYNTVAIRTYLFRATGHWQVQSHLPMCPMSQIENRLS
jgi:hypothetical protein